MRRPRCKRSIAPNRSSRCSQECQSHDDNYKRNGTIDLYAALKLATGEVTHQFTPPAPGHRVQEVSRAHRQVGAEGTRRPHRHRQPLDPQDPGHQEVATRSPQVPRALHADIQLMAELGRTMVRGRSLRSGSSAAPIAASKNSPTPSPSGSGPGTKTLVPTSGTRPPTRSWIPSGDILSVLLIQDTSLKLDN